MSLRRACSQAAIPTQYAVASRAFTATATMMKSPLPMNVKLPKHRYCSDGNRMPHLEYDPKDIEVVDTDKHRSPDGFGDALARYMVRVARKTFDFVTGYSRCYPSSKRSDSTPMMSTDKWLNRAIFLESIAAVPGMVAGMSRHLNSLRRMKHDEGWIRKLLEEAENERMHLFFFLTAKQPSILMRCTVALAQGVFFAANAFAYCISPRFAHRFVGYLEEEAVHTYTLMLEDIDRVLDEAAAAKNPSHISQWRSKPAPMDFAKYWGLEPGTATYRDVILCIRADELSHREYNHMFADAHQNHEQSKVNDILQRTR